MNQTKLNELILYVARKSEDDPRFGAVKLNKILYYADFSAYRLTGASITGATYQKLNEGPAPREMLPTRRILLDSGDIEIVHRPYFTGIQQRIVATREPDISVFTTEELRIADEVVSFFRHMTAREISDFSHREPGWILTELGEDIPYHTAWLSSEPVPQEAEEYGRELVRQLEQ